MTVVTVLVTLIPRSQREECSNFSSQYYFWSKLHRSAEMFYTHQLLTFFNGPHKEIYRAATKSTQDDPPCISTWNEVQPRGIKQAIKFQMSYIPGNKLEVTDNNNFSIPTTPNIPLNIIIAKCYVIMNDDNNSYYFYHDIVEEPTRYTMILRAWGILRGVNRCLVDQDSDKVHLISRENPWTVIDKFSVNVLSCHGITPEWLRSFKDMLSDQIGNLNTPLGYKMMKVNVVSNEADSSTASMPLIVESIVACVHVPGPPGPVVVPGPPEPMVIDLTSDSDDSSVDTTCSPPYSPCSAPYSDVDDISDD